MAEIRILYVEDVAEDVVLISRELRQAGFELQAERVETRDGFLYELEHHVPDLIISDHGLPSFDGFTALAIAKDKCPEVPFIFVTGALGEDLAIETFESGANDYVLKSNLGKLAPAVRRVLRESAKRAKIKQKEHALRESEERFRMLVEGVKDYAIFMLNPAGIVTSWNSGAQGIHGYSAGEILGRHFSLFYPRGELRRRRPRQHLRVAESRGRFEEEGMRAAKNGKTFQAHVVITALRDAGGNLRGFAQVTRDITERKHAQEQIERLNNDLELRVRERTAQLEASNRELEAFSYSVSHDLRAPLRHILSYIEILEDESAAQLDAAARQNLRTISHSASRMSQLIDALLAFSRMGRAEMRFEPVGLATLFDEARHELRNEIGGRAIDWRIAELPAVRGDPLMLRQVFINLLSNALKYTRPRDRAVIRVGATTGPNEIVCFIGDNGVGFPMEYVDKLFGVFQRLHRPGEFEGVGIGLANIHRIISRHGGRTWGEGEVGVGATFYFSLPSNHNETSL